MKYVLITLSILGYCIAVLVLIRRLKRAQLGEVVSAKFDFWVTSALAIACHTILLYHRMVIEGGLNLGVFNALSLVAWMITLLVFLSSIKKPMECLAIILYPIAILALLLDWFLVADHTVKFGHAWQLQAHIFISIAAYSFLTVAIVQAIVLAIQDRQLHNRHPGGFIQALPPLQLMEKILFQLIGVGFILLTIGLLIGFLFVKDFFGQHLVHKTVLSTLAWTIFAVLLWGRWRHGWRGRKAIHWVLGGFIALMLAFIGTKTVFELILHRPWS